jgi:tetratricopeptide (TPR) repeat protein
MAGLKLRSFLETYPTGRFTTAAHFYAGQCKFSEKNPEALADLEWVVQAPLNDYTEEALLLASTLRFNAGQFEEALAHYLQLEQVAVLKSHVLEARIGILRCSRELRNSALLLAYADPIIADPGTPDAIRTQAYYERGLLSASNEKTVAATADFEAVLKAGGPDAEGAAFNLAKMSGLESRWADCQDLVFSQLNQFGGQSPWAHQAFLLLAESYIERSDLFQARSTYEAILENVEAPDVRMLAMDGLDRITALENPPEENQPPGEQQQPEEQQPNEKQNHE